MYRLSVREKRLLALLVGLLAFVFWYKTFFELLWPEYHRLQRLEEDTLKLQRELSEHSSSIADKAKLIEEMESEILRIQHQLASNAGFLWYDLGQLAEGRVTLSDIDIRDLEYDGPFHVRSVSMGLEGSYQALIDFVRELENFPGLSLQELAVAEKSAEAPGRVAARLVMHHYDVPGRAVAPAETGFQYQPFQPSPSMEGVLVDTEQRSNDVVESKDIEPIPEGVTAEEGEEEQEATSPWPLAPYTFPTK